VGTAPEGSFLSAGGNGSADAPLARIRSTLPALTGALRVCAEFVLANTWEVRGLSIYQVAARTGVSTNAVNRFTRRLGYSGYREFSQDLTLELGRIVGAAFSIPDQVGQNLSPEESDKLSGAEVALRVIALEQAAVQETRRSLDPDELARAVEALAAAERTLFIGTGAGLPLCQLAVYRLRLLGLNAACAGDPSSAIAEIHLLRPGDVFVAISFHGESRAVVDALSRAGERNLTTICITAEARSTAATKAHIKLILVGREAGMGFSLPMAVTTATVLEALVTAVAWVRRETSVPHANQVTLAQLENNAVAPTRTQRRKPST
jgi:DNA-binding MurR/RpiR family transcriptional regulator